MVKFLCTTNAVLNREPVTIENFVEGTFVKYINNDRSVNTLDVDKDKQEMAEFLSHF